MTTRTRFARLATFFRSRERLFRFSFCVGAKDVVGAGRERHIIDDGKGREKRSRSPNSGDQQEVAKSQTLTSPGEAAKAAAFWLHGNVSASIAFAASPGEGDA